VIGFERAIHGRDQRVLLLGVTPELAVLGRDLTAVDNSPRMIARIWPGDNEERRALLADWTHLPFEDASFDAVIGDGSLNSAADQAKAVLGEVSRLLAPGGKAAFRTFCSPTLPESLESIQQDVESGTAGNLHALKWRIAMALAALTEDWVVPVEAILETFNRMFPDRSALAGATGWTIGEISTLDAYDGADHGLAFPTVDQLTQLAAGLFGDAAFLPGAGYPLAERCPIIAWDAK